MASKKVFIDVVVDDKGTTKRVAVEAKKLGIAYEKLGVSARDAERAQKGAAQTSSNSTKNFSKMAQGISGGIVPAYAAFAAQMFALSAAFEFFKRAADLSLLRKSQEDYASSQGTAIRSITHRLEEASQGMLGFQEAAQAAAIGAAKGFSTSQLTALTEGAAKASTALGRSYQDTFDRLLKGVSKAEPELLDELGITLRLEDATNRYADALNKSRGSLTTAERSQAVYLETMRQLNKNFGGIDARANAFVQLGKTFEKLRQDIEEKILPVIVKFVEFLNSNATAAIAAFAAIGAIIVANITGLGPALKGALGSISGLLLGAVSAPFKVIGGILDRGVSAVASGVADKISTSMQTVLDNIELAELQLEENIENSKASAEKAARAAVKGGAGSKTLGALALGKDITPQALGRLKKDLQRVQEELEETGETASKAFAGMSVKAIKQMRKDLDKMGKTGISVADKMRKLFAKGVVKALKATRKSVTLLRASLIGVGKAARWAGNNMDKIGKFARGAMIWLTIIASIVKALDELAQTPVKVIDNFKKWVVSIANMVQRVLNMLVKGLNELLDNAVVRKILKVEKGPIIQPFTFADDLPTQLDALEGKILKKLGTSREKLQDIDDATAARRAKEDAVDEALERQQEKLRSTRELYAKIVEDVNDIAKGLEGTTGQERAEKLGMALSTIPFDEMLKGANDKDLQSIFEEHFGDMDFSFLGEKAMEEWNARNAEGLEATAKSAIKYIANLNTIRDKEQAFKAALKGGDATAAFVLAREMLMLQGAGDEAAASFGAEGGLGAMITEMAEGPVPLLLGRLGELREALKGIAADETTLKVESIGLRSAPGLIQRHQARRAAGDSAQLAAQRQEALIGQFKKSNKFDDTDEGLANQDQLDTMTNKLKVLDATAAQAKQNASDLGFIGNQAADSFATSMASAFDGIVQGTMSVKDAFKQMGMNVLKTISRIITELLVAKLLMSAFGISSPSLGSVQPVKATAAASPPVRWSMADGGIARGREAGYPATLHGTEAVVPLPNGNSIPVEMKGGGDTNNVSVNVALNNEGSKEGNVEGENQRMKALGVAISNAVQDELHKQKRPGGILSPHGAA